MMRPLAAGYTAEADGIDEPGWYALAAGFTDLNIYQVWQSSSAAGERPTGTSRLILKSAGDVAAAAEVRLYRLPMTERGIAYVRWGPLWRRTGTGDIEVFRQIVRALRNEYVDRRRMILRMNMRLFAGEHQALLDVLREERYAPMPESPTERTLLLDVTTGLDELRRGFPSRWRNHLNNAERAGLAIVAGRDVELFDEFTALYRSMLLRKSIVPTADIDKHRQLQQTVPAGLKMEVVLARSEGSACAGAVISALGDTALYLFGATNEVGMRASASYLVQWEVLKRLTAQGIRVYDLHGINPDSNPGTYSFKKGLAGKNAKEVAFGGHVQAFDPSISNYSVLLVEKWRRGRAAAAAARSGGGASASSTPIAGA